MHTFDDFINKQVITHAEREIRQSTNF